MRSMLLRQANLHLSSDFSTRLLSLVFLSEKNGSFIDEDGLSKKRTSQNVGLRKETTKQGERARI